MKENIREWINNFVSKSNPDLNGFAPCPYASKALADNKVDIIAGTTPERDALLLKNADFNNLDVKVFVYDPEIFNPDDFSNRIQMINQSLHDEDLLVLDDHPKSEEIINGVKMNQGEFALMFVQVLSRLDDAAEKLAKRGYYDGWPEDYLCELFKGRKDPRL